MSQNELKTPLTQDEIDELEQNYIINSAPFVDKLLSIFEKYSDIDYIQIDLKKDLNDLYETASKIPSNAIPYADLTTSVFKDEEDTAEGLINDIREFYVEEFLSKKKQDELTMKDKNAISSLAKITEHLSLALSQKNSLYKEQKNELLQLENDLKSEKAELVTLRKNFTSLDESLTETEEKYKTKYEKMTIDVLSMMGIFSTIIFAVFGGLSQIGAIGDNLAETPLSKILMYISLSSITLLLIVFISFNAISKLTNLKLKSCACKQEKCSCSTKQKHPTLYFSMFFFVDLFLFSLLLRAVRYSDWILPFTNIFSNSSQGSIVKFLIFSLFILFNFIMFTIYCSPLKKINKFFGYIRNLFSKQ